MTLRQRSKEEIRAVFPVSHSEYLIGTDEYDRRTKTLVPRLEIVGSVSHALSVLRSRISLYRRLLGDPDLADSEVIEAVPALQVRVQFIRDVLATLGSYKGFLPKVSARAEDMRLFEESQKREDPGQANEQGVQVGAYGNGQATTQR